MKENEVAASSAEGGLGLAVQPADAGNSPKLGLERAEGLVITEVTPGSRRGRSGVARGRFDFQINRRPVKT